MEEAELTEGAELELTEGAELIEGAELELTEEAEEAELTEGAEFRYEAQLRAEFDSCDSTSTGFLDRDELTELCGRLQLEKQLPLLLDTLLGEHAHARVNFQEFKDGFVEVLSRSLDLSTSEDDSSYLETAVPEEVKPKFMKGAKRYGRRSRPDGKAAVTVLRFNSEDSTNEASDPPVNGIHSSGLNGIHGSGIHGAGLNGIHGSGLNGIHGSGLNGIHGAGLNGIHGAGLRRATSLESVESLKSDDETGSQKIIQPFQCKARHREEEEEVELEEEELDEEEAELQLGGRSLVLTPASLQQLQGRVSMREFRRVLCSSTPVCSRGRPNHPLKVVPDQLPPRSRSRSRSPVLLVSGGRRVLSLLDDGTGTTSPDRVEALWTEEGVQNSREVLQVLDFPPDDRLSLVDLTQALDNELLGSSNNIHQAALVSYRAEVQQLQDLAETARLQRDKLKLDLDLMEQRNLQLVKEADERHVTMETQNQDHIRELQQGFRVRLAALRCQAEQEGEELVQQVEAERRDLEAELQMIRAQEAELRDELCSSAQENGRLQQELSSVRRKLVEAETSVEKLEGDLDQLLQDKFCGLDPLSAGLSREERFSQILRETELQNRELRDRNDELSSELELLKNRRNRKWRPGGGVAGDRCQSPSEPDSDMKRRSTMEVQKNLQPDRTAPPSVPDQVSVPDQTSDPVPAQTSVLSIQTELALEQLKQQQQQELQQLHIQMETQVNYYERSLEMMRQSLEVERKDISQAFKLEISELEEQKSRSEQEVQQLKEVLTRLQTQPGGGRSHEQERRMQWERAELEQNFAREISNLVQNLRAEKDQMEAELRLQMDREVLEARQEAEQQSAFWEEENRAEVRRLQEVLEDSGRRCSDLEVQNQDLQVQNQDLQNQNQDLQVQNQDLQNQNQDLQARLESQEVLTRRLEQELQQTRTQQDQNQNLVQENRAYTRLADQLSTQILEMEEENRALRDQNQQLDRALRDQNQDQNRALSDQNQQLDRALQESQNQNQQLDRALQESQNQNQQLDRALQDSQARLGSAQQDRDREKSIMGRQLEDLENLVLDLENLVDPGQNHRTRMEEVRSENRALQENLEVLQQQVQNLQEDQVQNRRRLEEAELQHQRSREEEELLQAENQRFRQQVLDLSSRNLQLSSSNGELSLQLQGQLESVRRLQERLATVSREEEQRLATVSREEEEAAASVNRQSQLEAELSSAVLKLQWAELSREELQRDAEERNQQVEDLQQQLVAMETEAELLHSQLHVVKGEELGHALSRLQVGGGLKEEAELLQAQLEEERRRSQQLEAELEEGRRRSQQLEVERRRSQQLEAELEEGRRRGQQMEAELEQERRQSQQLEVELEQGRRRSQQLEVERRRSQQLEAELEQERRRSQQLEAELELQVQQSRIKMVQSQKASLVLQHRVEDLDLQLKGNRLVLKEKLQQLQDQVSRSSRLSVVLKDVYVENSQLVSALTETELRQKQAEKKNLLLEDKLEVMGRLLREVVV